MKQKCMTNIDKFSYLTSCFGTRFCSTNSLSYNTYDIKLLIISDNSTSCVNLSSVIHTSWNYFCGRTSLIFSFASLSRIENISIISNNAKTTVSGGSRQQLSSLLENSE